MNISVKRSLTDHERCDWLRLARTENIGPITFRHLLRRFGNVAAALDALPAIAERGGKKDFHIPSINDCEGEIIHAEKNGARLIASCEADYPEALFSLEDAPPVLTVRGHTSLFSKRTIGIVGTSQASAHGLKMAELIAQGLAENDVIAVSGILPGIDTAAHLASLKIGSLAILSSGIGGADYRQNQKFFDEISDQGCLLSEMPFGHQTVPDRQPRASRLISGLSLGIVVVEAGVNSRSLITAQTALEQGREVFAVPGSPLEPHCAGTNDLIRQGAILTEKALDILIHIHHMPRRAAELPANDFEAASAPLGEATLSSAREKILGNLGTAPISVEELVRQCRLSPYVISTVLLDLELSGQVERRSGHKVIRVG